ncbi:MAG: beta-galactosidase [Lentisphaeria bacterium]|nr:beta-galactosidase [Lentisphaeria bacterium]
MERFIKIGDVKAVKSSMVQKSSWGLGFEKLDRDAFDPANAYDKVADSGIKWARIQSGWAKTEKVKGVYDFAWLDSIVDNLKLRGIAPWMCICYGNGLYNKRAAEVYGCVGCPPIENEEEKVAWLKYVEAVIKHFQDRVEWFEIWNEPDYISCWKTGVNGTDYGIFLRDTAIKIRETSAKVKIIGGSTTVQDLAWLTDVINTGALQYIDAYSYHSYSFDERLSWYQVKALKSLCLRANPDLLFIQGETGTQSRSDGAGGLSGGAWTPVRQAKCLARVLLGHTLNGVFINSFFSCMDMIEALDGKVGDKNSYMDFGYFGVLGADFDENGMATGEYRPKLSYRTLQVLSAIFREDFSVEDLPVRLVSKFYSPRLFRNDDMLTDVITYGVRKPNDSSAFIYWKPTELLSTSYEATISIEAAGIKGEIRLVNLLDGNIYEIPEKYIERNSNGAVILKNMPLLDYPLMITFGDFVQ